MTRTETSFPHEAAATADRRSSYHGQPVIKSPVWTWEIPVYFFTGGLGGASSSLALLAEARGNQVLARRAWLNALGMLSLSPVLLISDLGRPARFLNMLRMFKVTSPMSVGSWLLAAAGSCAAVSTVNAWTGLLPRLARPAKPAVALLGLPMATYTAALVANTAVPVWHYAHRELPFLFGSGAALSAGATAVMTTPVAHAAPARRLALLGGAAELGIEELMEKRLGEHAKPYNVKTPKTFKRISQVSITAGAALLAARGGRSRPAAVAAGALLNVGALAKRWSVFKAGFVSAMDPHSVIGPQRGQIERGERRGAARRQAIVEGIDRQAGSPAVNLA